MSGGEGSHPDDGDLSANRFGIDGEIPDSDEDLQERLDEQADLYAELAARQMDAPKGEWWP